MVQQLHTTRRANRSSWFFFPLTVRNSILLAMLCSAMIAVHLLEQSRGLAHYANDANDDTPHPNAIKSAGILSNKDISFFRALQRQVDQEDNAQRCQRYGVTYNNVTMLTHPRRLFLGALTANEPRELLEIVSTESYGIYTGVVLVESNRTQNFTPRRYRRLGQEATLRTLFGTKTVQVRAYTNEDPRWDSMSREHDQRAQILKGWKELGMRPMDVGIIADLDETFSRDFLRAAQVCDFDILDYSQHKCHPSKVNIIGQARTFETSPECIAAQRRWLFPTMVVGQCIEGITDPTLGDHPSAPRLSPGSFRRAPGYGHKGCNDFKAMKNTNRSYPLLTAADFRTVCQGGAYPIKKQPGYDVYSAFHFHNFFPSFDHLRNKHLTYGHSDHRAGTKPWTQLGHDNVLMYNCLKGLPDSPPQKWKRIPGGFRNMSKTWPLYFQDEEYRRRRHLHMQQMLQQDDERQLEQKPEHPDRNGMPLF